MSWIEVESKFHVKNVKEIRRRIKGMAKYIGIEYKRDDYFSLKSGVYPKKSLRVRDKGRKREVNFKQRISYVNGIHAKNEVEFGVSDLKGFFNLLDDFGFEKWLQKEKKTELYITRSGVNIELNHVKKLGWYVELEVLCSRKEIGKARAKILKVKKLLDVEDKDIEKRGYTKELWDLKKKK
jgi:predicted adenylyl cyclase CyaB